MSKYSNLINEIYGVFNSAAWKAEGIKTVPTNFLMLNAGEEFIRVSVVPSGGVGNVASCSGMILIDIFVSAGNGPKRSFVIADKLDKYLVAKTVSMLGGSLQLSRSAVYPIGVDVNNESLYRVSYSIPFNFFGVF